MVVRLKVKGISFNYDGIEACNGIDLEVEGGEIVSIIGPNGSGKTTILKCMAKILKPHMGVIYIDGKNLREISHKEAAKLLAYAPQNFTVNFPFTVFELVLMGRKPFIKWHPTVEDVKIVMEVLKLVGIENLADRRVDELSGGEKQKVMIANILAQKAHVLLLDEPTANLDIKHQLQTLSLIRKIAKERDVAVLMALHDLNLAARFSDKIVMLKNGKVVAAGQPSQVLTPKHIKIAYEVDVERVMTPSGEIFILPMNQ